MHPPLFSTNDKRALRQQEATFEEKDGVLFHGPNGEKVLGHVVNDAEKKRLI